MHDTQNNTIKQVEYLDEFQTEERGSRIPVGAIATQLSNNEQYAGGVLQFFPTAEGYVAATESAELLNPVIYNYVYNYTDHLDERNQSTTLIEVCEQSSIRLSYTKDPVSGDLEIMEEIEERDSRTPKKKRSHKINNSEQNHYYPFGLKHDVYAPPKQMYKLDEEEEELARPTYVYETEYQYKYNGKEWQDELGLNMYNMDMRQYDPAIARWVVMDPVVHHSMSPYNAFDNNPVFWADPSGADAENEGTGVTLAFGVSLDSVMGTSNVEFQSYGNTTKDVKYQVQTGGNNTNISREDGGNLQIENDDCWGLSLSKWRTRNVVTKYNAGDSPQGFFSNFMSTALGSYRNLMSTQAGREFYYNLHNSALSKSVDNAVMGTILSVAMLPLAAEYGTIILLRYGADVTMQYIMTGNVNFYNAAAGSVVPGTWSPVAGELSDASQNYIKSGTFDPMKSALKIGTGYIGNGLGETASMTTMGTNGSVILESFHNNLQSTMIDINYNQ